MLKLAHDVARRRGPKALLSRAVQLHVKRTTGFTSFERTRGHMNRDEARAVVVEQLHRRGVGGADGIAIIESETIEKPYGWIFFYNSRRYVDSGELVYALVGQGPVVVLADTGEFIELGSAYPSEVAIRELEDHLQLGKRSRE